MNSKYILQIILTTLLASVSAKAGFAPPVDVGSGHYRFSDLKPGYEAGVKATEASLTGTWKAVAMATTSACASLHQDLYAVDGIKNNDGTFIELEFGRTIKSNPPGTSDQKTDIFSVKLNNLGGDIADQGPYQVSADEPQFSQWGYYLGKGSAFTKTSYFSNSCRISASSKYLICAIKAVILDRTVHSQESLQCADDKDFSEVDVYIRK